MAQLKSTKVFGDLNVTGEVNASTKITVNGKEVWDTGNLLNIGTTAATARTALGLGAGATRWPTFAEVTGKPATYAPSGHTHPWAQVTGQPAQATRWPTFAEVTGKPIVQTTGTSTTDLMSQKATTDAINAAAGSTKPSGSVYTYDSGRVVKITDDGVLDTIITYNGSGTVNSVTYPNGRIETYSYDSLGNVTSMTATGG